MNADAKSSEKNVMNDPELDKALIAYGRRTYARLLKEYNNRELALEAVKSVLLEMYTAMKATGCADPLEAMMYSRGKKFQSEYLKDSAGEELNLILRNIMAENEPALSSAANAPAKLPESALSPEPAAKSEDAEDLSDAPEEKRGKKGGFWSVLLIIMLVVLIAAVLWVIAGLAMSMGLIPEFDLGYAWFNSNVTLLF